MLFLSDGNRKIGDCQNVSFAPRFTCPYEAPCRQQGCYAWGMYLAWPEVRKAWDLNTHLAMTDPYEFAASLEDRLLPGFARFLVGGDWVSYDLFRMVCRALARRADVHAMCYTKRYDWATRLAQEGKIPSNFAVILSAWPGWPLVNPAGLPVSWVQDGTETRVPQYTLVCPGECERCGRYCWHLSPGGGVVIPLRNGARHVWEPGRSEMIQLPLDLDGGTDGATETSRDDQTAQATSVAEDRPVAPEAGRVDAGGVPGA